MVKRSGSNTQALLGGVLLEIVRTHFAVAIALCFDDERTRTRFARTIRSFTRLVELIEAKDPDGAEAHWRAHMEGAAEYLLDHDPKTGPVVDLFS